MKKIADIPGIYPDELEKLRSVFSSESAVSEVILYGSRAKGSYRPGSDIDLTLKGEGLSTRSIMQLSARIDNLLLPYEVDLSILTHIDNVDLINHIERIGKVVFKNEK